MFGKDIQFKIERLTADTRNFVGSFSCGNLEINDYINNEEAFYDCETVTYLLLEKDDNDQFTKLIGFLSLSCSAIIKDLDSVDSDGRPYDELAPAALIEYFAITEEYHGILDGIQQTESRYKQRDDSDVQLEHRRHLLMYSFLYEEFLWHRSSLRQFIIAYKIQFVIPIAPP